MPPTRLPEAIPPDSVPIATGHESAPIRYTVARSFFDNLDVLPVGLRLFTTRWSPAALIGRNLPPHIEEGRPIVTFAIGRHRWRLVRMPTVFELGHQVVRKVLLFALTSDEIASISALATSANPGVDSDTSGH